MNAVKEAFQKKAKEEAIKIWKNYQSTSNKPITIQKATIWELVVYHEYLKQTPERTRELNDVKEEIFKKLTEPTATIDALKIRKPIDIKEIFSLLKAIEYLPVNSSLFSLIEDRVSNTLRNNCCQECMKYLLKKFPLPLTKSKQVHQAILTIIQRLYYLTIAWENINEISNFEELLGDKKITKLVENACIGSLNRFLPHCLNNPKWEEKILKTMQKKINKEYFTLIIETPFHEKILSFTIKKMKEKIELIEKIEHIIEGIEKINKNSTLKEILLNDLFQRLIFLFKTKREVNLCSRSIPEIPEKIREIISPNQIQELEEIILNYIPNFDLNQSLNCYNKQPQKIFENKFREKLKPHLLKKISEETSVCELIMCLFHYHDKLTKEIKSCLLSKIINIPLNEITDDYSTFQKNIFQLGVLNEKIENYPGIMKKVIEVFF